MYIKRDTALEAITSGQAHFDGITRDDRTDRDHWILTNTEHARTDHCPVDDGETLVGCINCGTLVDPAADRVGIGCHCPDCGDTL